MPKRNVWITLGGALFLAGAPAVTMAEGEEPSSSPELEAAFESIARMSSRKRDRLLARCVEAAEQSGAPQVELVAEWRGRLARSPSKLDGPTEFDAHDARRYEGGPRRRTIGPGRNLWDDLRARIRPGSADPRPRAVRPAAYEFATGAIVNPDGGKKKRRKKRKGRDRDRTEPGPELPFRNLLEGRLPDQALAEEVLLRELDARAAFREEALFFAHLYCDRDANAYEEITLYDFWSAGIELEVPDPDVRAYATMLWNDDSVPVPLTEADHAYWYPRIEASLRSLRTYQFTTRALVSVWFEGRPELGNGYSNSIDILNAAVALCEADPACLAGKLAEHRDQFLSAILGEVDALGNEVWNRGNARRDALAEGRERIAEAVRRVLEEEGLL